MALVRRPVLALLAVASLLVAQLVIGQEVVGPIPIGGGGISTRIVNGQTVEISAAGVNADVYFTEFSGDRITGFARRTSPGSSSGTVTVRWINRHREVTVGLGPETPEVPFGMENGDVDKRSSPVINP
jgi:hypothetical protein